MKEWGRGGVEWGGEGSSTGHQLLSDYIIPDIKTTHNPGPRGGPRKEGGGGVWASLASKPIPILTPRPLSGGKMGPHPYATSGPHPAGVPPARQQEDSEPANSPAAPRGARDAAAAKRLQRRALRLGQRCSGAPAARISVASPRPPAAHPRPLTCAALRLRNPFTWSSPRPPPAQPRRLRGLRRAREPVGLSRAPKGRRRVSPAQRRILLWHGRRPPGGAVQAAALCAPGEPSV